MHIKTTMRQHLTPVRMAVIKKSTNSECWRGCGEKRTLLHCWQECKLVQPKLRTVWGFLKQLEIELSYDPAIPLLGIYSEKTNLKHAPQCSQQHCLQQPRHGSNLNVHRQMNKENVVCICVCVYIYIYIYIYIQEYYSAIKRMQFCHLQQHGWIWRALH